MAKAPRKSSAFTHEQAVTTSPSLPCRAQPDGCAACKYSIDCYSLSKSITAERTLEEGIEVPLSLKILTEDKL